MKKYCYWIFWSVWLFIFVCMQLFIFAFLAPSLQETFAPFCSTDFMSNNLGLIASGSIVFAHILLAALCIEQRWYTWYSKEKNYYYM